MAVTNTSYANIPFWNILPMGVTNYGGDTQIFTVPDYVGGPIGMYLNPLAQAQVNTGFYPGLNLQQPQISQDAINNMANAMLYPVLNRMTSATIDACLNNIAITTKKLNAMLQNEDTKKYADEINALLDRLKEQEEKLKELTESTDLDPKTANKKANEIEKELRNIVSDANKIGKTDKKDEEKAEKSESEAASAAEQSAESEAAKESEATDEEGKKTNNSSVNSDNKFSANITSLVDRFYDATYRNGTDNDEFNAVCESISKDNVLDVMLAWKQYHGSEKGESFMTAFMYDADRSQKIKYGKMIARALRDKATELGVYDQCREDFAKIDKEMGSWFYVNNDVAQNYDNIIKVIAEKEGKSYNIEDFKY